MICEAESSSEDELNILLDHPPPPPKRRAVGRQDGGGFSYWGVDAEDCGSANSFKQSSNPMVVLMLPHKRVAKGKGGLAPNVRERMRTGTHVRGKNRGLNKKRYDVVSLARKISGIRLRMLQSSNTGKGFSWGSCLAKMVVQRAWRTLKRACPPVDEDEGPPKRKSRSSSSSSSESSPRSTPSSQAPATTPDNVLDFKRRGRAGGPSSVVLGREEVTISLGHDAVQRTGVEGINVGDYLKAVIHEYCQNLSDAEQKSKNLKEKLK